MPYRGAFWAVVGGAAPVIALAAVIPLGDWTERASGSAEETYASDPARTADDTQARRNTRAENRLLLGMQVANICLQGVLLVVALLSLADAANVIPADVAVGGAATGLALLAATAVLGARAKVYQADTRWLRRMRARSQDQQQ